MAIPFPDISPFVFELPAFDVGGFHIGPIGLRWYALAYLAGLIIGYQLMLAISKSKLYLATHEPHVSQLALDDLLFYATLGVLLGGRLGYVFIYKADYYLGHPLEILRIWEGGMSFHGGFLGVCVAVILAARQYKIPLLSMGDIVALVSPLGLFFGRIANFINQELWGRPTNVPWAFLFPNSGFPPVPRHPSQLYEAALEGILLFAILWFAHLKMGAMKKTGLLTGMFIAGYAIMRTISEQFREPDSFISFLPPPLTMGALLSTPMFLAGLFLIFRALAKKTDATA